MWRVLQAIKVARKQRVNIFEPILSTLYDNSVNCGTMLCTLNGQALVQEFGRAQLPHRNYSREGNVQVQYTKNT